MYLLMRDSVMPRPIAWVSTIDAQGQTNLAPYSFFNVVSPSPPVLGFSVGPRSGKQSQHDYAFKDTLLNIRATGEFVINVVPERLLDQMVRTADLLPHGASEFAHAGLTEMPSATVKPPRVLGAPVAYECTTFDILEIGQHHWVMGLVRHVHLDAAIYDGLREGRNHRIDILREEPLRPVGRLGRANYVRLRDIETRLPSYKVS